VSLNTYLIASTFNKNRETDPERRASSIRNTLLLQQKPDLCFFQEVWGSGFQELFQDPISQWYSAPHQPFRIFSYWPFKMAAEMGHTLFLHLWETGGLFDLASCKVEPSGKAIQCTYRAKHTFTKSRSKSLKGVEATLWKIPPSIWTRSGESNDRNHYSLLVFNTHLDPWHPENRQSQIREILHFMEETLEAIDGQKQQELDENWSSRTGVLVLGDLNIKADTNEYYDLLLLNNGWKDLFSDFDEEAETYSRKNSLTCYPDDYGRIDYVFGVTNFKSGYRFLPLKCRHRNILEQPTGKELSDHYALQVELIPDE
jgi:endonuclease/exonuclease/phosphatase family metal-dependent hydrolase